MFLEYLISNVNADQGWHQWLLLLGPAWASVNKFLNHLITVGFHVLDLQVDGLLDITQSKFFIGLGAHSLGHHLLLDEWCELVLVFGEMLFWDTDFGHDLLLEGHANLLDLSHALGNHSEVLIKVLISFLFIVHFSVFFEVFREFEDLFFGGFKGENKYFFDILKWRILHVN